MERAAASSEPLLDQQKAATPPWRRCIPATPLAALLCVAGVLLGVGCAGWAVTQWLLTGAGSESACGDRESCLRIVDAMLANQPRQTFFADPKVGLMQTFGPNSVGGGPCGSELCELVEPCPNYAQTPHCRFDTYDNALAAIYLSKRGDFDGARRILDAFIGLLYPPHSMPGITIDPKDGLPSNRSIALLAAGYTDAPTTAGMYAGVGVADGALDTGNNAWAAMAFAHFAAASGESCYAAVARDMLHALKVRATCDGKLGGFASRFQPYPHFYRSTEHNVDMFALSTMLGDTASAALAHKFVSGMYAAGGVDGSYATGTGDAQHCDNQVPLAPSAVDAQFWNLLAGADANSTRKEASIDLALREAGEPGSKTSTVGLWEEDIDRIGNADGGGKGAKLQGVRFSTWGNGIQWENTASSAIAMAKYLTMYGEGKRSVPDATDVSERLTQARSSLRSLLNTYGCVPASILGGNIAAWIKNDHSAPFPGGSDTGIGWTYLRYPHVAATAWTGLLLLYQFDEQTAAEENANPFAPPKQPVPARDPAATKCFPNSGADSRGAGGNPFSAGGAGASCKAHKGCSGLEGNCCPTDAGDFLGCCD